MAAIDSDKLEKALLGKMKAERRESGDWYYLIRNDQGVVVATTSMSKGAKHTLGPSRTSLMARQLCLNKTQLLANLVSYTLKREDALKIIEENCPPGIPRQRG